MSLAFLSYITLAASGGWIGEVLRALLVEVCLTRSEKMYWGRSEWRMGGYCGQENWCISQSVDLQIMDSLTMEGWWDQAYIQGASGRSVA